MHVVIFEGNRWPTFAPLSLSRPVMTLATGMSNLLHKQVRHLRPSRLTLWVRPELAEYLRQRIIPTLNVPCAINEPLDDQPALLISGRTLHFSAFEFADDECVAVDEPDLVRHAFVEGRPGLSHEDAMNRTPRWLKLLDLPRTMPQTRLVDYLWDLIKWNEESLIQDYATLQTGSAGLPAGPYHIIEPDNIWLGEGASIKANVVLDASRGPVMIDRQASIGAGSVIEGPCYLGPYSQVAPLTLIRPGTTIGIMCKVAGEISNSIMFAYSNKAHYGYLGDSYIGKWVNLGAGTTTSNLKNTYGEITARCGGGQVATGTQFLGSMIGDHSKTAIETRLMAGTYVGFGSMVATSAIAPKFVPSYTFLTDKGREPYALTKAIEVMKTVFGRRDRQWNEVDDQIVNYVAQTSPQIESK